VKESVFLQKPTFLEQLKRKVLVFDGSMGAYLQSLGPTKEDFAGHEGLNDYLVVSKPSMVRAVHDGYLKAGCDAILTNTLSGSSYKLSEYGLGSRVREINRAAAELAREAADAFSTPEKPRYVVGDLGPSGFLPASEDPDLGRITVEGVEQAFYEQTLALLEGGVDALIVETGQDILEVRASALGARRALAEKGSPAALIVSVTLDSTGRMLLGTDIASVISTFRRLPIDVLGLNCSTGPREMKDPVRVLSQISPFPIIVQPNAGIPENRGGKAHYPLTPEELAAAHREFVREFGVGIVGGCCGTTPEHIRQVVEAVGVRAPAPRVVPPSNDCSSMIKRVPLDQEPKPLIVGERINAQGSRKAKEMLLKDDYEGLLQLARTQAEAGAHALDVCVAMTERTDERAQMRALVKKLALGVDAPLMIDTTEPEVLEAALAQYPGRALVNSINLEGDGSRLKKVCPVARRYGALLVALTIDEQGMAKTRERKLEVAKRIQSLCEGDYGIPAEDLLFDCLTFTLATGEKDLADSAVETLEAIRSVKREIPGARTILGLSNVSFGLSKPVREVLNSVFLYHAVKAGLDAAILNPLDIRAYASIPEEERRLAEDLLFNRGENPLAALLKCFEGKGPAAAAVPAGDPLKDLLPEERVRWKIVNRKGEGIEADLDGVLKGRSAVDALNNVLLPAMKEVGDRFGAGEIILPFVLQSAEVMKRAVSHVEKFLDKNASASKGTVVLATVYGDVHDIGKNLVKTILSNNGYAVHDLGKQVPVQVIVQKARELKADAIGLSALLVSTSKQMPLCVEELAKEGLAFPVLLGGAAINHRFAHRAGFPGGTYYEPGVFYAKDAFEGLSILNRLADAGLRDGFRREARAEADRYREIDARNEAAPAPAAPTSSTVRPAPDAPKAPFFGTAVVGKVPLREVWKHLDLLQLYKLNWGVKAGSPEEYQELIRKRYEPLRLQWQEQVLRDGLFDPRALYGFFQAGRDGDSVAVLDVKDPSREVLRFSFPRQRKDARGLCLADYFRPLSSDGRDTVAFHVVTAGPKATEAVEKLNREGKYTDALFLHGLAVQTAEAMAEWLHRRIRAEWGLPEGRGKRYSPGYPALPDPADNAKIFALLEPERHIGMSLTPGFMMVPEQSTCAIILHHPDAEYFAV
jgi:5-methyltetrahydrofolate--homocysteine methyltransferase